MVCRGWPEWISFFFSKFSGGRIESALRRIFCLGTTWLEMFLFWAKRDKPGNQFGFVRFRGVKDVAELLRRSCYMRFGFRILSRASICLVRFDIFSPKAQFLSSGGPFRPLNRFKPLRK